MGVVRITAIPCPHCGERSWYTQEPEEKRVTRGNLIALALFPVRILDEALGYLAGRGAPSHAARVNEGLRAAALRKSDQVRGVQVAPGELVCASCGYRIHRTTSERAT
jgi:hypothetical protein